MPHDLWRHIWDLCGGLSKGPLYDLSDWKSGEEKPQKRCLWIQKCQVFWILKACIEIMSPQLKVVACYLQLESLKTGHRTSAAQHVLELCLHPEQHWALALVIIPDISWLPKWWIFDFGWAKWIQIADEARMNMAELDSAFQATRIKPDDPRCFVHDVAVFLLGKKNWKLMETMSLDFLECKQAVLSHFILGEVWRFETSILTFRCQRGQGMFQRFWTRGSTTKWNQLSGQNTWPFNIEEWFTSTEFHRPFVEPMGTMISALPPSSWPETRSWQTHLPRMGCPGMLDDLEDFCILLQSDTMIVIYTLLWFILNDMKVTQWTLDSVTCILEEDGLMWLPFWHQVSRQQSFCWQGIWVWSSSHVREWSAVGWWSSAGSHVAGLAGGASVQWSIVGRFCGTSWRPWKQHSSAGSIA